MAHFTGPSADVDRAAFEKGGTVATKWSFADADEQVRAYLTSYVDEQYSSKQDTVDNLKRSLGSLVLDRDKQSANEFMRNSEYYLRGRLATGAHKHLFVSIVHGGFVYGLLQCYTGLKEGAIAANGIGWTWPGRQLQSSKGSPVSLPGGALWYRRGAYDGFSDNPTSTAKPVIPQDWPLFVSTAAGAVDLYDAIP
jgi:hypothetical protein